MSSQTQRYELEAWANGTLSDHQLDRMTELVNQWEREHPECVADDEARQDHAAEIAAATLQVYEYVQAYQ